MNVCQHCGSRVNLSERECLGCGAPVQIRTEPRMRAEIDNLEAQILNICKDYEDMEQLHIFETVPARKLRNARKAFNIPPDEKILLLYDDTVFGSNKDGFALCASGIFWEKNWRNNSKRDHISWAEFADRKLQSDLDSYGLKLGRGDVISLTQGDTNRIVELFVELKRIFLPDYSLD
jgi:hypothetical protein